MRIGLNNFLRFIAATGLSKVNQVLEAVQDYRDWKDYYKDFREEAVLAMSTRNLKRLKRVVDEIEDDVKAHHYEICFDAFQKWLAKTDFTIISHPAPVSWDAGEIRISVNPELIIDIDGVRYIVKLYLAKERLSQPARRAYAWLVNQTHGTGAKPAILEVRKGRLNACPDPNKKVGQWIKGEVAAFVALWKMNRAA
jgi:hypothetical protein